MPGPGPHMLYTLGTGQALMAVSGGRFGPHHCLVYAINAFFGPDMGSFAEWLTSVLGPGRSVGSAVESLVHHPFYYILVLGFPLCLFYSLVSKILLQNRLLDSVSGVPLTRWQCFFLISAGSLSHFFLDHLFEENGETKMYKWILSTGWWKTRAPITPDAVVVISFLCICLLGGFIYLNRVTGPSKSARNRYHQSAWLIVAVASCYGLWCGSQIYLVSPRRPAVGEEADLGVIVFFSVYFFLPHYLCILSMNSHGGIEVPERSIDF